ncbi:hypothetical protein K440DRAFT_663376 [Wilcoxina mikolae CBS 423.85]|nr:hypothetical protein K440DRAFT_663376 [Wilcoxina mikolae CBS 423.85]
MAEVDHDSELSDARARLGKRDWATHPEGEYRKVLLSKENFQDNYPVRVLELHRDTKEWENAELKKWIEDDDPKIDPKINPKIIKSDGVSQRMFFFTGEDIKMSDGRSRVRVSLSKSVATELFKTIDVSPFFCAQFLGLRDYGGPGDFSHYDPEGELEALEFFCQPPRWPARTGAPPSVYMKYIVKEDLTLCMLRLPPDDPMYEEIHLRLTNKLATWGPSGDELSTPCTPYLLHGLVMHLVFEDVSATSAILRSQLYEKLNVIDNTSLSVEQLSALTRSFSVLSRRIDSHIASIDSTLVLIKHLRQSHSRFGREMEQNKAMKRSHVYAEDCMRRLECQVENQRAYLESFVRRKDTGLSLVFHLITQMDSRASISMAKNMQNDSWAMKVLAALNMLFLPAMFVSGLFGMQLLSFNQETRVIMLSRDWYWYPAISLPLTAVVWYFMARVWQKAETDKGTVTIGGTNFDF